MIPSQLRLKTFVMLSLMRKISSKLIIFDDAFEKEICDLMFCYDTENVQQGTIGPFHEKRATFGILGRIFLEI